MGYAVDENMKVDLVKAALKMAYKNMIFSHESVIHGGDSDWGHSDTLCDAPESPMHFVLWDDVQDFIEKLNARFLY